MAEKVLVIFEKPIYLSFEPVDPHLFATALGVADSSLGFTVLLKDSAVTYAVEEQTVRARILGQDIVNEGTTPARIVDFMLKHGAYVQAVREDLEERGIPEDILVKGVRIVPLSEAVEAVERHDSVIVW